MENKPHKLSSLGFTLIELLVVIGILGILIVALIAALDPLEQIRKGNDAGRKAAAGDLRNALARFYATQGAYPWLATVAGDTPCNGSASPGVSGSAGQPVIGSSFTSCIVSGTNANLEETGELKSGWINSPALRTSAGTSALFIELVGSTVLNVCFDPESKSESLRAEAAHNQDGSLLAGCPAAATACYQCVSN